MGPFTGNIELLELHMHSDFQSVAAADERAIIDAVAGWVVEKGCGPLAVFVLEAQKPLRGLGYHAALGIYPLCALIGSGRWLRVLSFLLSTPGRVEALAVRIEELLASQVQDKKRGEG
ncbi:MAG: hypothetical protein QY326_04965 [Bdellovibrionota bacterium]|nr:MAG: hypothetical protein QY326_04965 [Bdellovibrionota bacterium]